MYNIELLLSSVFVVNVLTHYRKEDTMSNLSRGMVETRDGNEAGN